MYLVKYSDNYADEFDIQGFRLFTETEYNEWDAEVCKLYYWPATYQFGTNEDITYEDFDSYRYKIDVLEISEERYNFMSKCFGTTYGNFFDVTDE